MITLGQESRTLFFIKKKKEMTMKECLTLDIFTLTPLTKHCYLRRLSYETHMIECHVISHTSLSTNVDDLIKIRGVV